MERQDEKPFPQKKTVSGLVGADDPVAGDSKILIICAQYYPSSGTGRYQQLMYTILYVDDEKDLLDIGKIFLERNKDFSVDTITSATAALALMKEKAYDAVVADYQMPGMDGIAFLKEVRASGNTVPFILFTGRGREEIVIQALNEGADFYLQKGGDPVAQFLELSHKVKQAAGRKKAEASLHDLERREQDIINFLPDPTFAIDRNGAVIAWNRAIEEMTGVPAQEMMGKGNYEHAIPIYGERRVMLADLLLSPPGSDTTRLYSRFHIAGNTITAETSIPHLQGKPRTLWGKASFLYDRQGNVVGAIESIRDITDRRLAEDALRQANRKLSLMASVTRHDVVNRLTVLRGFLVLTKKWSDDAGFLHLIQKQEEVIARILREILFTKEYQEIGVHAPVWQNVEDAVRAALRNVDLAGITVTIDGLGDVEVFADPLLQKVFFNLADNSVRHGGAGLHTLRFSARCGPGGFMIVCEDDGCGIPREEKSLIFERGFGRNTGLGLFLITEILAITGITIAETGEPGKGARFEISVPEGVYRIAAAAH